MGRKLPAGSRLVLASHNPGKLAELTGLLRPYQIEVISAGLDDQRMHSIGRNAFLDDQCEVLRHGRIA